MGDNNDDGQHENKTETTTTEQRIKIQMDNNTIFYAMEDVIRKYVGYEKVDDWKKLKIDRKEGTMESQTQQKGFVAAIDTNTHTFEIHDIDIFNGGKMNLEKKRTTNT